MRCRNCGWVNSAEVSKCAKCGVALTSNAKDGSEAEMVKKTVREFDFEAQQGGSHAEYALTRCSKCGYPIARGMHQCPQCGWQVAPSREPVREPVTEPAKEHHAEPVKAPASGNPRSAMGTVNPWANPQSEKDREPTCSLCPVRYDSETVDYEPVKYKGNEIILNRSNTDPSNCTITSKTQAILTKGRDGWYIIDQSDQKTTYVHAGKKTKIEDGDIIILGDRRFIFKA